MTTRKNIVSLTIVLVLSLVICGATFAVEPATGQQASGAVSSAPTAVEKVDINTATWEEMTKLYRVGEKLAKAIVADREANGPFRSTDDLTRVMRIGKKIVDQNRAMIYVDPKLADTEVKK